MQSRFRLSVFLILFCLLPLKLNAAEDVSFPNPDVTISMDFQDANLKDILKIFSMQSGMNFIASEALQDRKITLFLDKVPVQEAMDELFKANNLSYELDSESNIFIVKDLGKPETETITKVFYLKYRSVPSANIEKEKSTLFAEKGATTTETTTQANIVTSLKEILSANGKITEDSRTNSLIVTDIPTRMPIIEKLIASLDVPMPQVMLEVEMLDVSKNLVDKMGFEFGDSPLTLSFPGKGAKFFLGSTAYLYQEGALTIGHRYAQLLHFLRTQTDTKYLARPRLLTLNNETAEIAITKDEIATLVKEWHEPTSTAAGYYTYTITRATELKLTPEGIGIFLRVTPQINQETGEITMVINPKSSSATQNSGITDQVAMDPEVRSTKSIVKVRDGETVILGGLIHTDKQVTTKKLPILGDIPLLGALFRHKNVAKNLERELIVFITPHIIKDTSRGLVSAKKALPIREQGRASALDRQIAINTTLDRLLPIREQGIASALDRQIAINTTLDSFKKTK